MSDTELIKVLTGFKDEIKKSMNDLKNEIKAEMTNFKEEIRAEMANFKEEIRAEMANFKEEIRAEMASFKEEIRAEMASFKKQIEEIKIKIDSLDERLTNLEGRFAIMEHETRKQLDTIFDYIKQDLEKHEETKNHFNYVESTLIDHSIRLSIIESTNAYKNAVDLMKKNKNSGNTAIS